MSLFNLKLFTHIWSTNINFRLPILESDFLIRLGLNFHSMGELRGCWASDTFFRYGQKRDYLSRASSQQRARGTTKNPYSNYLSGKL